MSEAQAVPGPPSRGLISRLWRGEVSLGKTYWLYGVFPNVALRIALVLLSAQSESADDPNWAMATLAVYVFQLFYAVFIMVCIWRSARKSRSGWARAAQAVVVLSAFGLIANVSEGIGAFTKGFQEANNPSKQELLKQGNAGLPRLIDNATRLDNVNIVDNNYIYSYTILTLVKKIAYKVSLEQR